MDNKLFVPAIFFFLLFFNITYAVTAPVINPHLHDHDGIYTLSWSAAVDPSGITNYEIQEATTTESNVIIDNAESGLDLWEVNGFTAVTVASYSATHSFYSGQGNNLNNYISLRNPIPISGTENLSFWTKYNTKSGFDYLYVQVSIDNINWSNLGSFYGSQSSFIKKSYSLSSYVGQNIYVRFKYVTDSTVSYEGVYIDDITVEKTYNFLTISNSLASTSYDFSGKTNGIYYYHVRAKNTSGEWGAYSAVASVEVGSDIYPSPAPTISCGSSSFALGDDIDLTWTQPEDESGIAAYELQEITGLPEADIIDDGESGISKWTNNGFSLSTSYFHGASHSFYSGSGNYLNNSLTLVNPIQISGGGFLKFWCYYSLENSYDNLYVQVSTDGSVWGTLGIITGNQLYWAQKSYDLSAYAGQQIFIRFKYETDSSIVSSGIYIDDLTLDYNGGGAWSLLSDSLTSTTYKITGKNNIGYYSYRVRAKDAAGNLSAYSSPITLTVASSFGIDLAVSESDISFLSPECAEGDMLGARIRVHNLGTQDATAVVSLYYNAKDTAHFIDSNVLSVSAIATAETGFTIDTKGMGKNPLLYVIVSSLGNSDSDLSNNEASKRANVISLVRPTLCYPNPFNPAFQTTKFAYRLDRDLAAQIIIFDVSGRIIWRRSFIAGTDGAKNGLNEVEWNGITDYSEIAKNGIYIYKVLDDSSKQVLFGGKVMVLK
jgi:hypothetical protein